MTIGMNNLGRNGRIGNQLFQYAALVGIAKNKGYDFVIPENQELSKCFDMLHCGGRYGYIDGGEVELHDSHEFCSELFSECPNHIHLNGYFQSEKYFKDAWRQLKWDFRFKEEIDSEVDYKWGDILREDAVSICVREFNDHFDYPGSHNNHRNLPWSYFEEAIEMLGKDRPYIICSNNLKLCQEQEVFKGSNFYFNDITTKVDKSHFDLCLLSKCTDHIISNSTFSWWGAYLCQNPNKRVIAPSPWYGPGLAHISTQDLFPESWEVIDA
jgi:hypothetical protein